MSLVPNLLSSIEGVPDKKGSALLCKRETLLSLGVGLGYVSVMG